MKGRSPSRLQKSEMTIYTFMLISLIICLIILGTGIWVRSYRHEKRSRQEILTEDLLKTLACTDTHTTTRCSLMESLCLSPGSLDKTLGYAKSHGWIHYPTMDLVAVTDTGLLYGRRISRAHRLCETYLAECTGYPREEWHRRAEVLEHHLSSQDMSAMAKYLDNPTRDPNGEPIPTADGEIPAVDHKPLKEVQEGGYVISAIRDKMQSLYSTMLRENLCCGSPVQILRSEMGMELSTPLKSLAIPLEWQDHIYVSPSEENLLSDRCCTLWDLRPGERAVILQTDGLLVGENRRRLSDLGFVKGGEVSVYMGSPLGNPKAYVIRDTVIALRKDQAEHILIRKIDE